MKKKKLLIGMLATLLLLLPLNSTTPAQDLYTVRGDIYIDDVLATGNLQVSLHFNNAQDPPPDNIQTGYHYEINLVGAEYTGQTGTFTIDHSGTTYSAFNEFGNQAYVDILPSQIGYFVDLYIYTTQPNIPPTAEANGPYTAVVNIPRTFDATGSTDPDGTITTYEWDFNGDGSFDATTTSKTITHTYTTPASYTITLRVTDNDGATDTDTAPVTITAVDNQPPSKVTGVTVTDTKKGGQLQLTWDAATDNVEISHYRIYQNTVFLINSTSRSYLVQGLNNGETYTFNIVAIDTSDNEGEQSDNATGTPTKKTSGGGGGGGGGIPLVNQPPIADASQGQPYQGTVNEPLTFDGSLSNDPDGSIISWEWNFGDDTTGSGEIITHSYTTPGIYTVTLTVADNNFETDTDTVTATILQPNIPPTAPTISGPKTGIKNFEYPFIITATDSDNDTLTYTVEWDDTQSDTATDLPSGTAQNFTHAWTAAGAYQITATASDNQTQTSNTQYMLIDTIWIKTIGYLMDTDGDNTYDTFYSNSTGEETDSISEDDKASYLIDEDGDGTWDWQYYPDTDTLEGYTPPSDEIDYSLWILLIILIIIILVLAYLVKRGNDKKKAKAKAAAAKKEKTKKETPKSSKKSSGPKKK